MSTQVSLTQKFESAPSKPRTALILPSTLNKEGEPEFLLLRRSKRKHDGAGEWAMAGETVKPIEIGFEGAVRGAYEELWENWNLFRPNVARRLIHVEEWDASQHYSIYMIPVPKRFEPITLFNRENTDFTWAGFNNLPEPMYGETREFFETRRQVLYDIATGRDKRQPAIFQYGAENPLVDYLRKKTIPQGKIEPR